MPRRRRLIAAAVLATAGAYYAANVAEVWLASRRDEARPAEAIVVLGAAQYDGQPSAVLRARLDHAGALFRTRLAPVVVVTGGRRSGDRFTEARVGAAYLHRLGVPESAILRETSGRTSWESLAASARFLRARGIDRVVLVSDPFHAARIAAIGREVGLSPSTSPTRTSPIRGLPAVRRMLGEALQMSLGRVLGFRRLVRVGEVRKRFDTGAILRRRDPGPWPGDTPFGGGVIGNTAGSGPVIEGSSPSPRALTGW